MFKRLIPLVVLLASGCPPGSSSSSSSGQPRPEGTFPEGFLWGTATAGFQVEAGCPTVAAAECEDRNSDWYQFVMSAEARADPSAFLAGHDISAAPGFYELYPQDLARAKNELHNNAFRLSVEWSRIFPNATFGVTDFAALRSMADPDALAFYHAVLTEVHNQGLVPLVTLNHYTLPLWIHDGMACRNDLDGCTERGWLDARITTEIAKFSGFVAQEFGDQVDMWATQNEPMAIPLSAYIFASETRSNPPALTFQLVEAKQVMAEMQIAHARMYDAIKAGDTDDVDSDGVNSVVGIVFNMAPVFPRNPNSGPDEAAAEDADYLYNTAFLNAVVKGDFDPDLDGTPEHRADMEGRMDYLGVNYYTRVTVEATSDGLPSFPDLSSRTAFNPLTITQGEDYAKGIYDVLMVAKEFNIPIYITENGSQDPVDNGRGERFLVEHLTWLSRAVADGADVRGYFWWSLMDNFEWNHGMEIRMGLYAIDHTDATKTRVARRSVAVYGRIAEANSIPADLMTQYPVPH